MFGIKLESDEFFRQIAELISRLDETHMLTFAIGVVCVAALFLVRRVNRRLARAWSSSWSSASSPRPCSNCRPRASPSSARFRLASRGSRSRPSACRMSLRCCLPPLPSRSSSMRTRFSPHAYFAGRHGQKIDANQEFVAIGMANLGAGFFNGFPAATSGSRTAVADQMGGKSQWVGLIATALTIIFLLFFTPLLAPLPTVVLGAMIIVASFGLLDVAAFRFLRKVRSVEFWLAVVTAVGVLTVGILQGVLVAVVLSLINVIYHISRPHDALLDDVDAGGGTVYRGVTDKQTGLTEPGLIVYRFDAPLVFANAAFFTERLEQLVAGAGAELKCVILDAEAISDFDSTAAEALETLDANLERIGVELWIARANGPCAISCR